MSLGGVYTPPSFYVSNFRLIGQAASPDRFSAIVGPIAARLAQRQNAEGCVLGAG